MDIFDAILHTLGILGLVLIWVMVMVRWTTSELPRISKKNFGDPWPNPMPRVMVAAVPGSILLALVMSDFPLDLIGVCIIVVILGALIKSRGLPQ